MNPTVSWSRWQRLLLLLALCMAAIVGLYRETAIAMVTIWYRSETFTHAFLVPPIALWLVWRQRGEISPLVPRPAWIALVPMAGIAFVWLLGDLTAVNSITQLCFVAMLVLTVPAIVGTQVAKAIAFPLCFLFFAVPIGEFLMPQFMVWTADFTVAALRMSGVPVLREGLQFVIPSGNWSVVEACSGIRYLIASVTVGTLFAYLNYQSTGRRIIFVVFSLLLPIVANWIRAYMIVMLGHLSGNKVAVGVDHLIYGWVFFGVVIVLMFLIGARWSEAEPPLRSPVNAGRQGMATSHGLASMAVTATVLLLAMAPLGARWWINASAAPGKASMIAPAALGAGWTQGAASASAFKPNFENPSAEINVPYSDGKRQVGLYLGFYRHQDYSRKLVSSSNVLVTSNNRVWSVLSGDHRTVSLGSQPVSVRTAELKQATVSGAGEPDRWIAWQIYWINGTLTASDYAAKAYSATYRLLGRGDDSAVIVVYATRPPAGSPDLMLESFMAANYGAIDTLLRQVKASR